MIKHLTAIALLCLTTLSIPVYAVTSSSSSNPPGWDKLTDVQKAEINKQVAIAAAEAATVAPTLDVKKVDEYVVLGERIGKMMGGAAKEVGVAVNTFVDTPVGKWTMAMIVWKFMGNAIVHVAGAAMLLLFGLAFLLLLLRRRYPLSVTYRPELFLGVFNRKATEERAQLQDSDVWFFSIAGAVVAGAAMVVLLTGS